MTSGGREPKDRRRCAVGGVVLALGLVLTGCSSDDTAPGAGASSTGASPTQASTGPAEPAATYTQAPATGALVDLDTYSFHVPEGWPVTETPPPDDMSVAVLSRDIRQVINVSRVSDRIPSTAAELADFYLRGTGTNKTLKLLAPVTIAGQEWFHLAGVVSGLVHRDVFGTQHSQQTMNMTFDYDLSVPEQRRVETTGSVLASFQLK